jgi:crotonobetainyl-CoA:carnitine CoA-transferase CaiB-like acyl-CoA transferase
MKPLEGVVVADFSQLVQGPFATQILGDLGATVIKIEPPRGEWMRSYALQEHHVNGHSISFLSFNRNKKSIALDLRSEDGKDLARRIVERADVLIENFRPGVMDRLGLGYDEAREIKPDLIYCSSTGYGSSGPYESRPGQDLLIQAITGIPTLNGLRSGPPTPVGFGLVDMFAGMHITYSVLAGLIQRDRTGSGTRIEVSLLASAMALLTQEMTAFLATQVQPERSSVVPGSPHAGAPLGLYETSDGHIVLAMNSLALIGEVLDIDGLRGENSSNVGERRGEGIHTLLQERLRSWQTAEVIDRLLARDVWCAPLQDLAQVSKDPQIAHLGLIREIPSPGGGTYRTIGPTVAFSTDETSALESPPELGEHRDYVLSMIGVSQEEAAELAARGAFG